MALARIITRSQSCSRELALDLLARGYAVEIVSPDKIPDNIADLELRVDAGPGDQLIATVETHDGERSASLDFVHHLKAPMVDFMRRSPELREAVYFPEEPVSFDAEPEIEIEDVEPPVASLELASETVSVTAEPQPELDPELDLEDAAHLVSPPDVFPSLEMEPPIQIAEEYSTEDSTTEQPAVQPTIAGPTIVPPTGNQPSTVWPTRESKLFNRSARSFRRDLLIFASVMLLALVLGYGIRRSDSDKTSAQNPGAVPAEKTEKVAAASSGVNLLSAADPEKVSEKDPQKVAGKDAEKLARSLAPPPAIKSEGNSGQVPKESQVTKPIIAAARTSILTTSNKTSRRHSDDLIARDTVTYLDKRFKPVPKTRSTKKLVHRHPVSHKQGGIVAANTVTYLNNTPAPKTAKRNSVLNPSKLN
jgi:hypothetical protein